MCGYAFTDSFFANGYEHPLTNALSIGSREGLSANALRKIPKALWYFVGSRPVIGRIA